MEIINYIKKNRKYILVLFDIVVIALAYILAFYIIDSGFNLNSEYIKYMLFNIGCGEVAYLFFLLFFGMYNNITRYENGKDYLYYAFISLSACAVLSLFKAMFFKNEIILKIDILSCIIIAFLFIAYRIIIRMILTKEHIFSLTRHNGSVEENGKKNLLIIGAGTATRDIIKAIKNRLSDEYNIIGIIDDNKNKIGYSISGVKILADRSKIEKIAKENKVNTIFFTICDIKSEDKKDILEKCQNTGAKIRILPSTENIIKNNNVISNLRDIDIADILCRDPIVLDNKNIANLINKSTILVTGAGGSIGSELCRQIIKYEPKKLIMLDIYENSLYDIQMELTENHKNIEAIICSVRDVKGLEEVFKKHNIDMVFHAAAHKHVPLMERRPVEAIKNNVFGTYNVVNMADKYNVKRFVLISSDKAVNPTNIMGATKRFCEMLIQAKNKVSKTEYMAVRFGNVLESNGSVVPLFKKQIAKGGPVTVTDKRITRFFMTIPEAVQLVLQAMTYANGGEIFVLDMGEPVKIYDLAQNLIKLSGFEPNVDIKIEVIGLRPGEKLYEELLMAEEGLTSTAHEKIFIAKPLNITMNDIEEKLDILNDTINNQNLNNTMIKDAVTKVIPTYTEAKNKLNV